VITPSSLASSDLRKPRLVREKTCSNFSLWIRLFVNRFTYFIKSILDVILHFFHSFHLSCILILIINYDKRHLILHLIDLTISKVPSKVSDVFLSSYTYLLIFSELSYCQLFC